MLEAAAGMGSATAMYHLGYDYIEGECGVTKDEKRGMRYLMDGVKKGDVASRRMLALVYAGEGNFHLATKHLRLAAEAGDTCSVKILTQLLIERKLYEANLKEIYLAHKSARAEMESEDRQRSAARDKAMSGNDDVLKGLYTCYYVGYISAKQLKEVLEMHRNGSEVQEIRKFIANARNGK